MAWWCLTRSLCGRRTDSTWDPRHRRLLIGGLFLIAVQLGKEVVWICARGLSVRRSLAAGEVDCRPVIAIVEHEFLSHELPVLLQILTLSKANLHLRHQGDLVGGVVVLRIGSGVVDNPK